MAQYAAALLARWNALPRSTRGIAGATACVASVVAILAALMAHPQRAALFATPLHPEQLSEVQERLASWNVPFTPTADNVVVDASRRNDVLLKLSLSGVPHAHVATSAEALAAVGVLTPQAVIDAQARAGLAGDLESGLRDIDGVDDARVIVAPAKAAEFGDDAGRDATASVRLRLRPGAQLSTAAIDGIRAFVAAGVSGLDPQRVTIVDDRGVALGNGENGGGASELAASLQSALDEALGDGVAIVRVRAEYTSDRVDAHDVRRTPLGAQPIGRADRTESYADGAKHYRHDDLSEERGSDTVETTTQAQPGAVKRISAAVFVDESRAVDLAKVRDLSAAVLGFDARRGDALVVQAVDFHRAPAARKDAWWLLYGTIVPLAPAIALALAAVAIARIALPPLAGVAARYLERAAVRDASRAVSGLAPSRVRTALEGEPPHAAAAIISALPAATAAAVLELYPQHERDAIVRRMQRPQPPFIVDPEEYVRRHG
ncbi:MAG: hypothetical protein JO175_01170 [Candidatus Eremiobacteraeota bacterium]|nr:hypothetical protein [Candidatus Eremiobacteraeota bacterium]